MPKKQIIALIVAVFLTFFLTIGLVRSQIGSQAEPEFHAHADFAMFINGQQFDFSLPQFMSIAPCVTTSSHHQLIPAAFAHGEDPLHEGAESSLGDWVHLHDGIGTTIHLHKEGVTYAQFFESIGMAFSDTSFTDHEGNHYDNSAASSFRFFINNKEVDSIADLEIKDLDSTLITYGPQSRSQESINAELVQITDDACFYSESCTHRGLPAYEQCGAVAQPPFILKWIGL